MKVRAEVNADHERPITWGQENPQKRLSVTIKLTIDAVRGEAVVGTINAVLEGARKTAIEAMRAGA